MGGKHSHSIIPKEEKLTGVVASTSPLTARFIAIVNDNDVSVAALHLFLVEHPNFDVNVLVGDEHPFFKTFPRSALHLLAFQDESSISYDGVVLDKTRLLVRKHHAKVKTRLLIPKAGVANINNEEDDDEDADDDDICNQQDPRPTALYVAVDQNNCKFVRTLISLGHRADAPYLDFDIGTPLALAVDHKAESMVKILLSMGGNPTQVDHSNSYGLLWKNDDVGIAKCIISMGANVNARSSVAWTCMHFTPVRGNLEYAQLLVANGGNPR